MKEEKMNRTNILNSDSKWFTFSRW